MNEKPIKDERYAYVETLLENKFIEFKSNKNKIPTDFKSVIACMKELYELKNDHFTMFELFEISTHFYKPKDDNVSNLERLTKVIEFLGFEKNLFEWELIISLYHEEEARKEENRKQAWKEMINELWNM